MIQYPLNPVWGLVIFRGTGCRLAVHMKLAWSTSSSLVSSIKPFRLPTGNTQIFIGTPRLACPGFCHVSTQLLQIVVRTAPAIYLLLLDKPSLSKRSPACRLHPLGPVPSPGSWPTNFPLPSYCFTAFKLIIFIFYLAILSSSKEYHLNCLNYLILHHRTVLSIFRISTHYLRYVLQYVSLCHLPFCISESFFIHTQISSREFTSLWFYCLH